MQKSYSLNNLNQNNNYNENEKINYSNENEEILSKLNIDHNQKLSLIERKKLKWANETSKL